MGGKWCSCLRSGLESDDGSNSGLGSPPVDVEDLATPASDAQIQISKLDSSILTMADSGAQSSHGMGEYRQEGISDHPTPSTMSAAGERVQGTRLGTWRDRLVAMSLGAPVIDLRDHFIRSLAAEWIPPYPPDMEHMLLEELGGDTPQNRRWFTRLCGLHPVNASFFFHQEIERVCYKVIRFNPGEPSAPAPRALSVCDGSLPKQER